MGILFCLIKKYKNKKSPIFKIKLELINILFIMSFKNSFINFSTATGNRTPIPALRTRRPKPLDDSGFLDTIAQIMSLFNTMESKKTIVFLHGWGLSSKILKPFYHYFKNDFTVYFLELPGFGDSPIEKSMTLKDYADVILKFIKDNTIENPIIVGHSFGGAVAAKLAILHPEIMSKLILVSASAIRQPRHKIILIKKMADFLKPLFSEKLREFVLKLLKLDQTDYAQIESPELKETFKNVITEDLKPYLSFIKSPTLVIWGEKDAITPLSEGKLIAENIPNAKLAVIKNTGHFMFLERPDEFVKLIKEFAL